MPLSGVDRETGEFGGDEICVKCNSLINQETGEWEEPVGSRNSFKIPSLAEDKPKKAKPTTKLCCSNKYTILLMVITLIMILPKVGVTLWLFIEVMLHLYIHRKPHLMVRYPLHRLAMAEFCGICQAERCKDRVGKLQDMRTSKMRQYFKSMPIGT
ncbi:uncharacterized protein LOC106662741 [Cimex lectularius]|uniref:Uncharacterized protein n=1 Tax=Cimex lectularius TaxID=79782 RepID=A0A8I6RAX5_CIMLE|nr:uncharacterized protein LOC106662741 [Cimex lectularius]XP_014242604.1 uncharacterized protein LOC106662741 [Cimex lectularius]